MSNQYPLWKYLLIVFADDFIGLLTIFGITENNKHTLFLGAYSGITYPGIPQLCAQARGIDIDRLLDRRINIHLHQEVNPAAQIQAQVHGQGIKTIQPPGCGRCQVQRNNVIRPQCCPCILDGL